MPVVASPALHGRGARVIVEGIDFSCRLRDVDLTLTSDSIDITQFCAGMKQSVPSIPDGKLTMGGFLDAGTKGTHAVLAKRLGRGQEVAWTVQAQGHDVGGHASAGTGIIAELTTNHTVSDVISTSLMLMLTGDVWVTRTLVPVISPIVAAGAWSMTQVDRQTALVDQYALAPYSGLLYYHYRNETAAPRTLRLYSSSSPMAAGAAPGGATGHGSITVAPGEVATGAFGTLAAPLAVDRYVAAYIEDSAPTERNALYIGLVDLELSIVQTQWAYPEPAGQLGWTDFNASFWDNGAPMLYAAAA